MAGMGLQGAAAAEGGFQGIQNWLKQALQLREMEQAAEDRRSGIARQALLDQRAGETHALQMERGRQAIDIAGAEEGRAVADAARAGEDRTRTAADLAAFDAAIDADPSIPPIAKIIAKASARRGGSMPAGLIPKPAEPVKPDMVIAPNGQLIDRNDPKNAGRNFAAPREPKAPTNEPLVAIKDPTTGQPILVPRSQAAGKAPASTRDQAMTEGQSNAAGFADRMRTNEPHIQRYEGSVGRGSQIQGWLPGEFQSNDYQSYAAAKKNWIAAQLRKESGAAISQGEYDEADRQYFPQPGDSAATIRQKRELRTVAEASMRRAAGHGAAASGLAQADPDDLGKEW